MVIVTLIILNHTHTRYGFSGRGIGLAQRHLPAQNIIFKRHRNPFSGGIRTRNPNKRAAADPRLRRLELFCIFVFFPQVLYRRLLSGTGNRGCSIEVLALTSLLHFQRNLLICNERTALSKYLATQYRTIAVMASIIVP
jgi:hypothetical protein